MRLRWSKGPTSSQIIFVMLLRHHLQPSGKAFSFAGDTLVVQDDGEGLFLGRETR